MFVQMKRRKFSLNCEKMAVTLLLIWLQCILTLRKTVFAEFSNLGLSNVPITDAYPEKYDRLLCGGIWCIVQLEYESEEIVALA